MCLLITCSLAEITAISKIESRSPHFALVSKKEIPSDVRDAAIFVTETLELSWASAQAVFEDKATPELALAIYDRIRQRIAEAEDANTGMAEEED